MAERLARRPGSLVLTAGMGTRASQSPRSGPLRSQRPPRGAHHMLSPHSPALQQGCFDSLTREDQDRKTWEPGSPSVRDGQHYHPWRLPSQANPGTFCSFLTIPGKALCLLSQHGPGPGTPQRLNTSLPLALGAPNFTCTPGYVWRLPGQPHASGALSLLCSHRRPLAVPRRRGIRTATIRGLLAILTVDLLSPAVGRGVQSHRLNRLLLLGELRDFSPVCRMDTARGDGRCRDRTETPSLPRQDPL